MNSCQTCGCERHPVAKPGNCQICHIKQKRQRHEDDYRNRLEILQYDVHSYDQAKGIHGKIEVTNRECGHTFTAKLDNILNGFTKCGVCGPKTRIKAAAIKYVELFGRNYDLTKWNDYKKEAWIHTNVYYKANRHILNPMGLPRKKAGSHPDAINVDHIIPMIYCFKNSLPIELATDPLNIRVISAVENLQKKQKLTEETEALLLQLRSKYSYASH